jgi:two-component system LytT family sensor kinase
MKGIGISGKKLKVLLHVVVWIVIFIFPTYLIFRDSDRDRVFMMAIWFQLAFYAIVFYLSYFWLAPRFFFSGRKYLFFIISALMIIVFTLLLGVIATKLDPFLHGGEKGPGNHSFMVQDKGRPERRQPPFNGGPPSPIRAWPLFNFLGTSCLVTGLSLGLRFSEKLLQTEKIRKEAEKEKLHTELTLLKHQINPHFLFNTLNSIYSLALIKSDQTAEAVMKLSDMMRYVILDVGHDTVPLSLELQYVGYYVELQKMRLAENTEVLVHIEGDPEPYTIPPMILVPFIENAFKYGTSSHESAVIRIDLRIGAGLLAFKVANQVFGGREKPETFGIGIQNTRQRLNLIYPGKHKLTLTNNGKVFIADLKISLA